MSIPVHNSVRILLVNKDKKILLMHADDPMTTDKDGSYHGKFWFIIGGEIEPGETILAAARRELHEETGLDEKDVIFGPEVWHGEFKLILSGTLTLLKQTFIVAHTNKSNITIENLTYAEKKVIDKTDWFSLKEIVHSKEIIYPVVLPKYLPDILDKNYPKKPIWIDLAKKPLNKTT